MKKIFSLSLMLFCSYVVIAQPKNPVTFNFQSKKISDKNYQIIIKAIVQKPWHIYAQNTDKGGPIPTKITFKPNPIIKFNSSIQEIGKLQKVFDNTFGVNVLYYSNEVSFVQNVQLKVAAKTNVSGVIEYMVCDDKECLPPKKQNFEITLQ